MSEKNMIAKPFWLVGELTDRWATSFVNYLYDCAVSDKTALAVICGEKGGSVSGAFNIAQTLKATGVRLITVGFGDLPAPSTLLFCQGDERILMDGAELMFSDFGEKVNSFYLKKTNISAEMFGDYVSGQIYWRVSCQEAKALNIVTAEYDSVIQTLISAYAKTETNAVEPFFFAGEVNDSLTKSTLEYIYTCAANGKDAFVEIESPGGSGACLRAIVSNLELTGVKLTTIGGGNVASAAAAFFLMGDRRALKPQTRFLLHKGRVTVRRNAQYFEHDAKDLADGLSSGDEQYLQYCMKKTHLTREEFEKRTKRGRDWIMEEEYGYGFTTHSYEEILKEILDMRRKA